MPESTPPDPSEPSMDEILASIRKIISEGDETPATGHAPPTAEPEALLLTRRVDAPRPPAPAPTKAPPRQSLVADTAAAGAASALDRLDEAVDATRTGDGGLAMPAPGRSLEDVTRELLAPMLKAWLDEHLEEIVRARVDEEVERISRKRVR